MCQVSRYNKWKGLQHNLAEQSSFAPSLGEVVGGLSGWIGAEGAAAAAKPAGKAGSSSKLTRGVFWTASASAAIPREVAEYRSSSGVSVWPADVDELTKSSYESPVVAPAADGMSSVGDRSSGSSFSKSSKLLLSGWLSDMLVKRTKQRLIRLDKYKEYLLGTDHYIENCGYVKRHNSTQTQRYAIADSGKMADLTYLRH